MRVLVGTSSSCSCHQTMFCCIAQVVQIESCYLCCENSKIRVEVSLCLFFILVGVNINDEAIYKLKKYLHCLDDSIGFLQLTPNNERSASDYCRKKLRMSLTEDMVNSSVSF
jgi:hypothetical protein